eukprot:scaffold50989_cov20-Tisochrysis_lutea.AAC.2
MSLCCPAYLQGTWYGARAAQQICHAGIQGCEFDQAIFESNLPTFCGQALSSPSCPCQLPFLPLLVPSGGGGCGGQ